jgi:hypothetical protein
MAQGKCTLYTQFEVVGDKLSFIPRFEKESLKMALTSRDEDA